MKTNENESKREARYKNMENQQKKVQEVQVQKEKETVNLLQMFAGLYSAGALFSVEGTSIRDLQYGLNRKKNGVYSFDTLETKKVFVLAFNGFVKGPNTTKFIEFKRELLALCRDASVFLQFSNLKHTKDERYYFSWLYDE